MYTNPTPEQLDQINQYTPANMEPLESGEVAVVQFLATDNLLNREYGKWGIEELPILASLLPGLKLILDHEWGEVEESQGIVFAANVFSSETAPDWAINQCGNAATNAQVVNKEGYSWVQADVAIPVSSPALTSLRFGVIGNVSLGGFLFKEIVCPICDCSFDNKNCSHFPPDPYWGADPADDVRVAPYYIRSGTTDLKEMSIVTIPKVPTAGVISRQKSGKVNP